MPAFRSPAFRSRDFRSGSWIRLGFFPALLAGLGLAALSCGGDGNGSGVTEPEPEPEPNQAPTVTIEAPAPDTTATRGDEVRFVGRAEDPEDGSLSGQALTWSSSVDGELGTGEELTVPDLAQGSHTVTLTATDSEGATGSATVGLTIRGPFDPETDVELSGEREFTDVEIPEDVTVTVTGDLTMEATGAVTIVGELTGDCVGVEVLADSTLAVTGSVETTCDELPDGEPPRLRLAGTRGYDLGGAAVAASGEILITDDPEVDFEDVQAIRDSIRGGAATQPAVGTARVAEADGPARDEVVQECRAPESTEIAPEKAPDGEDGDTGGKGDHGADINFVCTSEELLLEDAVFRTQDGGDGGDGESTNAGDVFSAGGAGGDGGWILYVAERLRFSGTVEVTLGSGGDGGNAEATAEPAGPRSEPAPRAQALAGFGGSAGTVVFNRTGEGTIVGVATADVRIHVGDGGSSGTAIARAANGMDASGDGPAQEGGFALAAPRTLFRVEAGSMNCAMLPDELRSAVVNECEAGDGVDVEARAGNGGEGNAEFPHGADGGDATAAASGGGEGGANGVPGVGGTATVDGANGGAGWDDCMESVEPGGDGGDGGSVEATSVVKVVLSAVGNGGDAGDGDPYGFGGEPGDLDLSRTPSDADVERRGPNFEPGADGSNCPSGDNQTDRIGFDFRPQGAPSGDQHVGVVRADGTGFQDHGRPPRDGLVGSPRWFGPDLVGFKEGPSGEGAPHVVTLDLVDGTQMQITSGAGEKDPSPTPDGDVTYVQTLSSSESPARSTVGGSQREEGATEEIFVMEPDGSGQTQVTDAPELTKSSPVGGPDGRIYFLGQREGENTDVYRVDRDGSNLTNLTESPEGEVDVQVSPDGTRIAFRRTLEENGGFRPTLWVAADDGSGEIQVAPELDEAFGPDWSPDSGSLVFIGIPPGGEPDVFRANADGSAVVNLTETPDRGEFTPDWAASGEFVAYVGAFADEDGNAAGEVFRMNPDGTGQTQLTDLNGVVLDLAVEP